MEPSFGVVVVQCGPKYGTPRINLFGLNKVSDGDGLALERILPLVYDELRIISSKYLRDEYINNAGNQPMERAITKHMSKVWGEKLKGKDLYNLFPGAPSKQGLKVAGLPATTRKGGY